LLSRLGVWWSQVQILPSRPFLLPIFSLNVRKALKNRAVTTTAAWESGARWRLACFRLSVSRGPASGIDPGEVRKVEKLTRHLVAENSFEAVAREWFNQMMPGKSASYQARTGRILEKDLYPVLGSRPFSLVSSPLCQHSCRVHFSL